MTEQLPKPIDPQDIRVGMRVRLEDHLGDDVRTVEFTVADREGDFLYSTSSKYASSDSDTHTWTLLADAPKPQPAVGSRWRDPETGAEYVATDSVSAPYRTYRGSGDSYLAPGWDDDTAIIARLQQIPPIPAFDPAALWPCSSGVTCGEHAKGEPLTCTLKPRHGGLHAAHLNIGDAPVYCWGDPR